MELFFAPLACSLASRIALYEAGAEVDFVNVNLKTKRTDDGRDFTTINPKGFVPTLRTNEGSILTEGAVILQYLADSFPAANLVPAGFGRYEVQQWLSFINSELHMFVFAPLFLGPEGPVKDFARHSAERRFTYLDTHLLGREWLLDSFSIADAYLAVILLWTEFVGLDLGPYANVITYRDRVHARPAVARAIAEERALWQQQAAESV